MLKQATILLLSALPLAACNKGPDINVKNASVGEVAEQVRAAAGDGSLISPGRWETKVTLLDVDAPGLPPQYAEQLKQSIGKAQGGTVTACMTEADVKKPREDFFAARSKDCRYDHFTMSGGKIDAQFTCTPGHGGTMHMKMSGTYSSDAYDATMAMTSSGGGGMGGITMKSHTESHRVGECRGDEDNVKSRAVGK